MDKIAREIGGTGVVIAQSGLLGRLRAKACFLADRRNGICQAVSSHFVTSTLRPVVSKA
jgi:hypothetical protein